MGFRVLRRVLLSALAALPAAGCAGIGQGPDVRALPVLERERPAEGFPRITDWLWPFGHVEEGTAVRSSGFRPLWRSVDTEKGGRFEVLYPLWRTTEEKGAISHRLFPLLWYDGFPTHYGPDEDAAILPFLFWGTEFEAAAKEGDPPVPRSYFLFFPFWGNLRQKLLSDETTFVLFPLYAGTETGKWRGHHVLWPLVHWGSDGAKRSAFRAWPFYGMSVKEGTYDRRSLLWPFLHWGSEGLDTKHAVSGWLVWPLVGREGGADGYVAWTFLWPFLTFADGPLVEEVSCPYPLFRTRTEYTMREGERVETSDLLWFWPFWGRYDRWGEESTRFYAWPVVRTWWASDGALEEEGVGVIPFWRSLERRPREGGPGTAEWKLWPLAQGESLPDGSGGWSALAPIPWFRWEEFDANWGVFFELARVRRGPDGSRATDLLFSLVRDRRGPRGTSHRIPLLWKASDGEDGASWSILEGLLGGETAPGGGSSLRLLWFLRIPAGGNGK